MEQLALHLFIYYILFSALFFRLIAKQTPKRGANKCLDVVLNPPPPGACGAGKGPADSTCSAGCSSGGWSGCAGSAAATAPPRSRRRCGPSSSGSRTADSYNLSRPPLNRCCSGLLRREKKQREREKLFNKTVWVWKK